MSVLYLDCPTGVSGDMLLGALLNLGVDYELWVQQIKSLPIEDLRIEKKEVLKKGIRGLKIDFISANPQPKRNLVDVSDIIANSSLPQTVKDQSINVFRLLADAESTIHGKKVDEIHFHELGALDTILDIVGVFLCLEQLSPQHIFCSPLPFTRGFVECAHGTLPVPAPAVLKLLKNFPLVPSQLEGELITPTGAAILNLVATSPGHFPAMTLRGVGCGVGLKDLPAPNILRAFLGEANNAKSQKDEPANSVAVLESLIDDITPEIIGYVTERLLAAGAIDVFIISVQMKKNRPGNLLTVLSHVDDIQKMSDLLFRETSTLGIRLQIQERMTLARHITTVETEFGCITVKVGLDSITGEILNLAPEYSSCLAAAMQHEVPLKIIYQKAIEGFNKNSKHRLDS